MRMKSKISAVIICVFIMSRVYCQTMDSLSTNRFTISHCFNIGTSFIFGKQFNDYDKLTTPYNFNLGYDVQFNFGKHFILQTGIQYAYKPYIYNLRYYNYDTTTSSIVNGLDELNVQYHSLYFRVRPGVSFKVGNIYETSIVANLFYGFNVLSNYSHKNLTPQYSYQIAYSEYISYTSHYWGGGIHWLNLFKVKPMLAIGFDIGYNIFWNENDRINEFFYQDVTSFYETNPHPLMNNHALVMNFLIKYK